ncbi:hypothetical protein HDU67_008455 [Dinochytrium kinnereticum]|nr:hypothetical protein HDU67_008455 [Dinochytrium kinnereticum]
MLQIGPSCGLVALEMAGKYLGASLKTVSGDGPRDLAALLEEGRRLGYTQKGEMFSAYNLASLATEAYGMRAEVVEWCEGLDIAAHLNGGGLCLVAYDKDVGYVIGLPGDNTTVEIVDLKHPLSHGETQTPCQPQPVMYMALHGKTLRQSSWSAKLLRESSLNLFRVQDSLCEEEYVFPQDGDIRHTLAGKLIYLYPAV